MDSSIHSLLLLYLPAPGLPGLRTAQNPSGSTWNTAAMDYSVSGLTYDANGNILTMNQNGFRVGNPTGAIDQLSYAYNTSSNQLSKVTDAANDSTSTLGDFHYKTKGSFDYAYDGNGNLKSDNNKGIDSIGYNFLNLPQYIHIKGKGTIAYAYDANGIKEAKITVDSTVSPVKRTTTVYVDNFQYTNDTLTQASLPDGRARWQKQYFLNGDSAWHFFFDYFLKDHLGNTRVVLTGEKDTANYMATMESAYRTKENALFYNVDSTSYPAASVPGGYPTDNTTVPNDSVAMVERNPGGHTQGPALLLKVMTGDSISIGVKSYYLSGGSTSSTSNSINSVLNTLAGGLVALGGGGGHGTLANLNNTSGSPAYNALNTYFYPTYDSTPGSKPKAYLNWMLLDNQFNYVSGNNQSGAIPVGNPNVLNTLATTIKLKHSGYLYIWVSNETQNWMVFFDNLAIQDFSGPMVEENHYYPFGLGMAGISDKAVKGNYAENKYRYNNGSELQNKEFSDGSGLELYETPYRSYDPQLGIFHQIDPIGEATADWSPYVYALDNPIYFNDPAGLAPSDSVHDSGAEPMQSVTVTPGQNEPLHIARITPLGPSTIEAPSPPSSVPGIPNNSPGPGVSPTPSPEPTIEPFPIGGPGVAGTAGLTIGLTILPLSMGQEGIPEMNPIFNRKPDSKRDENDNITLYRGVDPSNPNFKYALDGWAVPLGMVDGHNDPAKHNAGDTHSIYTSWTTRPSVAVRFAGQYGVVLVQTFKMGQVFPSPDAHDEQELLVPGVVRAVPYPAWTWRKL